MSDCVNGAGPRLAHRLETVAALRPLEHRAPTGVRHHRRVARQPSSRVARLGSGPLTAARAQLGGGEIDIQSALREIDRDHVTITYEPDRTALGGFWRDVTDA